jgi:hypothetical protein
MKGPDSAFDAKPYVPLVTICPIGPCEMRRRTCPPCVGVDVLYTGSVGLLDKEGINGIKWGDERGGVCRPAGGIRSRPEMGHGESR